MDIIEQVREVGRNLQKDERYLKMKEVSDACDQDETLQKMIGEFNLKRMSLNEEMQNESQDQDKIQLINSELRAIYAQIMQNPHMTAYNTAKEVMDTLLQRVSAIISQSADGEDPDTADHSESCEGSCSSCSGCH